MKINKIIIFFTVLMLSYVHHKVNAENSMNLNLKFGANSSFLLNEIKSMDFYNGSMHIYKKDGTQNFYDLMNVKLITFGTYTLNKEVLGNEVDNVKLSVYPNPAIDALNIKYSYSDFNNAELEIIGIDGKMVYRNLLKNTSNVISVSNLNHGLYLLRINNGQKTATTLFIKD